LQADLETTLGLDSGSAGLAGYEPRCPVGQYGERARCGPGQGKLAPNTGLASDLALQESAGASTGQLFSSGLDRTRTAASAITVQ
jgi:hypothetical protein